MADRQHAFSAAPASPHQHHQRHPHPTHDDTDTPVNHTHAATTASAAATAIPPPIAHLPDTAASPAPTAPVPTIRFIPYITDTHRGLNFPIVERKLPNGKVLHVKRFVEKGNVDLSDAIAFKSKVVSRQHGELWTEGMSFYYRDTKSSSGTFINNVRASPANTESQPIQLKDGDIIQLGVDYQGRTEDIFRCVRMRVELNREAFKHRNNAFRNQVIRALRALAAASDKDSTGTGDCCICLGAIAPFQALFIAPCCHSFHFKCARPLLQGWPNFNCPLCRHFADLSVSVSIEDLSMLAIDDGSGSPVAGDAHEHHPATSGSPTSPPTARHDDTHPAAASAASVAAPAPTPSRTSNLLDPTPTSAGNGTGVHFAINAPTIERSTSGNATPPLPSTGSGFLGVLTSPALQLSGSTAPSSADATGGGGGLTPVAPASGASTHASHDGGAAGARVMPGAFPATPAHGNTPTLGVPLAPPLGSDTSVASTQQEGGRGGGESATGSRESNNVATSDAGHASDSAAADAEVARVTQRMVGAESTSMRSSDEAIAQATTDEAAAAATRATSATPTAGAGKPQGAAQQVGGEVPASAGSSSGSPVLGASGGGGAQEQGAGSRGGNTVSGVATPVAAGEAAAR